MTLPILSFTVDSEMYSISTSSFTFTENIQLLIDDETDWSKGALNLTFFPPFLGQSQIPQCTSISSWTVFL